MTDTVKIHMTLKTKHYEILLMELSPNEYEIRKDRKYKNHSEEHEWIRTNSFSTAKEMFEYYAAEFIKYSYL